MSLELAIQQNTEAVNRLVAILEKGTLPPAAAAVVAPVEEKAEEPKPAKKAKAEKAPEPAKAEEPAADAKVYSYQEAATAITKLASSKGRDAAVSLLKKFGVAKGPELKPDQYAAVVAEAEKALAA